MKACVNREEISPIKKDHEEIRRRDNTTKREQRLRNNNTTKREDR